MQVDVGRPAVMPQVHERHPRRAQRGKTGVAVDAFTGQ